MITRCLVVASTFLSLSLPTVAVANSKLKGADEAVKTAERLVAAVGGKEVWAKAKSIYVAERAWPPALDHMITEVVWRDFVNPRQYFKLEGFKTERGISERAFDEQQGWVYNSQGEFRVMDSLEHKREVLFWPGDVYIMYHRLAINDESLTVKLEGNKLVIEGADEQSLGWFDVDANGAPVRWGLNTGLEKVEYVFGPMRSFGRVRFPAWGASTDGSWRYEYTDVELSDKEPPISFLPNKDWYRKELN